MKTWIYFVTPFVAWLVAGAVKFFVNCVREKRLTFDLIGYGGMPSNHSAIVASMASLVALREGADSAAFGVSLTLAYIVILDANSLRRAIGLHAQVLNRLSNSTSNLRERMGHTKVEITAGIFIGIGVAYFLHRFETLIFD